MALSVHIKKKLKDFELAVDFDMEEGIVGFLGSSGCGKSMTLKCIAGIETPDEGSIVLDGEVLFDKKAGIDLSPQKRKVGYLFQNYALFPHMTVRQIRKFVSGSYFRRAATEGGAGPYDGSGAKVSVIRRTIFSIRYLFERKINAGNDDLS